MTVCHRDVIQAHCRPKDPLATDATPVLRPLSALRAVLFDVYGTLLISTSGSLDRAVSVALAEAVSEAFAAATDASDVPATEAAAALVQTIQDFHARARAAGIAHPEVEIVDVWKHTIARLIASDLLPLAAERVDVRRLALEYEVRTNPVWPMPGLDDCLAQLRDRGMQLGLVSNAQFFTPKMFPALLGRTLEELGFDAELMWFSYRYGRAKPDIWLFEQARAGLSRRGVAASEVLYVGNDVLNDVCPASRVGFRTALFAGDARSFRPRRGDPRVAHVVPDLVITDLSMLSRCLKGA
ncbi:MAG: HAD family hydrolase [Planctomycetaceae bacterium]|nr:HAD family hydrolase [Planctomycetaceae bacterium]